MTYLNKDITYPYGIMTYRKDLSLRNSSSLIFHSNLSIIAQELSRFITMTYLYMSFSFQEPVTRPIFSVGQPFVSLGTNHLICQFS